MNNTNNSEFLHAMFRLKSLLSSELKSTKQNNSAISVPEYVLMKKVTQAKNRNVSLTEIREYLVITKPAVSQMLTSLEKRKLITRDIDKDNRRNIVISLTPRGKNIVTSKDKEVAARMNDVISKIGEDKVLEFVKIISKINDAIDISNGKKEN